MCWLSLPLRSIGSSSVGHGRSGVGEKALWPATLLGVVVTIVIGVLIWADKGVVNIIAVFSIVGNVVSLMLYNKVKQIETQTNGNAMADHAFIRDLVEFIKKTAPPEE